MGACLSYGTMFRYFPIGHVPYLMFVMCHPQMLALQRLCFNCSKEDLFFGQVNLNSKKPGHDGGDDTFECLQSRFPFATSVSSNTGCHCRGLALALDGWWH